MTKHVMVYASEVPVKDAKRVLFDIMGGNIDRFTTITKKNISDFINDEYKEEFDEKTIAKKILTWMNENGVCVIAMD